MVAAGILSAFDDDGNGGDQMPQMMLVVGQMYVITTMAGRRDLMALRRGLSQKRVPGISLANLLDCGFMVAIRGQLGVWVYLKGLGLIAVAAL